LQLGEARRTASRALVSAIVSRKAQHRQRSGDKASGSAERRRGKLRPQPGHVKRACADAPARAHAARVRSTRSTTLACAVRAASWSALARVTADLVRRRRCWTGWGRGTVGLLGGTFDIEHCNGH